MHIYFGEIPDEDLDFYEDEGVLTLSKNGETRFFNYGVEVGSNNGGVEDVVVYDSIGRSVPIEVDAIPELIKSLKLVYSAVQGLHTYKEAEADLMNPDTISTIA